MGSDAFVLTALLFRNLREIVKRTPGAHDAPDDAFIAFAEIF